MPNQDWGPFEEMVTSILERSFKEGETDTNNPFVSRFPEAVDALRHDDRVEPMAWTAALACLIGWRCGAPDPFFMGEVHRILATVWCMGFEAGGGGH